MVTMTLSSCFLGGDELVQGHVAGGARENRDEVLVDLAEVGHVVEGYVFSGDGCLLALAQLVERWADMAQICETLRQELKS